MFLVIIVTQFLLVNDGIVVVQLLSLVVIVSPNISNSTSRFCGTLNDDATSLLSAYYMLLVEKLHKEFASLSANLPTLFIFLLMF